MKLKNLFLLPLLAFLASAFLTGCSPYEEGPGISFRSAASRVENNWRINFAQEADGDDVFTTYENDAWEIREDGTLTRAYQSLGLDLTVEGTWELTNDNEDILITLNYELVGIVVPDIDTYEILKLRDDEMWIQDVDDDGLELHFVE